jgi:glycine/D-amino acid oxidase-like deaminating enzyme/nitrite reductase/ring-hydroxylating ferredoxin subunit
MKRNGKQISIWQDTVTDYKPVNKWDKDEVYDLLVVGGGITGLTTALLLQSEGKKCILAEAHNIGFGTTGGTTSHLNTMPDTPYDKLEQSFDADATKLVAASMREAIDLIEGLIVKYDIDCGFAYKTAYLFAENDKEAAQLTDIQKATERTGVVCSNGASIPMPLTSVKAIRVEMQAQLHATKYLNGLAMAYEREGGVLLQNCIVKEHKQEGHFLVETGMGVIHTRKIMYATHTPPGINALHFRLTAMRSYAAAVTLKGKNYPHALVYDMKDPYHYFRTQRVDAKDYLIAGGFDHKTGENDDTEQVFRDMEAYLRKHLDVEAIAYQWSSQYFDSADGLPYIGLLPGYDDIYVGTGYGGNGMVFGSLAAKMICERLTGHESHYQKLYDPNRIKPVAGFDKFVKDNADVVSKFLGMPLPYIKMNELAALAPGDATVAELEDKKVALYKDDNGKLHAIDPACPHAGCIVAWNNAEKSWDCPCHGSRFAPDGTLLTGPATSNLPQIKWKE